MPPRWWQAWGLLSIWHPRHLTFRTNLSLAKGIPHLPVCLGSETKWFQRIWFGNQREPVLSCGLWMKRKGARSCFRFWMHCEREVTGMCGGRATTTSFCTTRTTNRCGQPTQFTKVSQGFNKFLLGLVPFPYEFLKGLRNRVSRSHWSMTLLAGQESEGGSGGVNVKKPEMQVP